MKDKILYPKLAEYCQNLPDEFQNISEERKATMLELGDYIAGKIKANKKAEITVICTHNSRRSHFGQIWLRVAAASYGIQGIDTYSGGTEATAFNPRAVKVLENIGFKVSKNEDVKNPLYKVSFGENFEPSLMFSKKYDDTSNPQKEFAALMVCSDADEACPMVKGADFRLALPYQDPKNFDGTPEESQKYAERCREIARDMFYILDYVSQKLAEK